MQRSPSASSPAAVSESGTLLLDRWPDGVDTWPPDAPFGPWGHAPHAHPYGHLVYAASGACVLTAPDGARTVDAAHAVWVPAGVTHSARFDVEFCPVVLEGRARTTPGPHDARDDGCPHVRTVAVGPEQRAALLATRRDHTRTARTLGALLGAPDTASRACVPTVGAPAATSTTPAAGTLGHTGPAAGTVGHRGPVAGTLGSAGPVAGTGHAADQVADDDRLRGPLTAPIAQALVDDPASTLTLDEWAARLHVSPVSIRRAFLTETGMPFSRWRTRARLRLAVERLRAGEPVTAVAHAVGMSHNGLLAACRRDLGLPPSALHPRAPTTPTTPTP